MISGGFSYGEKGARLKEDFRGTYPDNTKIEYVPIHFSFLINRGPRAPMTQECIPVLF